MSQANASSPTLPPDVIRNIGQFLEPNDIARFRGVSFYINEAIPVSKTQASSRTNYELMKAFNKTNIGKREMGIVISSFPESVEEHPKFRIVDPERYIKVPIFNIVGEPADAMYNFEVYIDPTLENDKFHIDFVAGQFMKDSTLVANIDANTYSIDDRQAVDSIKVTLHGTDAVGKKAMDAGIDIMCRCLEIIRDNHNDDNRVFRMATTTVGNLAHNYYPIDVEHVNRMIAKLKASKLQQNAMGGSKTPALKLTKTAEKVNVPGVGVRSVHVGPRGGKYIKHKGSMERLSTVLKTGGKK